MTRRMCAALLLLGGLLTPCARGLDVNDFDSFNREEYEEDAGSSFAVLLNPSDEIYGAHFGFGTWGIGVLPVSTCRPVTRKTFNPLTPSLPQRSVWSE